MKNKYNVNKTILNRIGIGFGLILPFLIMMLGCIFDWIYYIQSDDYEINYISMGGISGEPNEHIVFIKSILGYVLKGLYNIYSGINWFGLVYLLLILICVYILFFIFKKYIKFCYALMISIIVEVVVLCWLTFTVIAYLCIVTAGLLFMEMLLGKEKNLKTDILSGGGTVFLFMCGFVIREDAFKSGLILLIPFLVFFIGNIRKKVGIIVALLSLVCIIGIFGIEEKAYESDVWQNYKEYNSLRAATTDFPINDYDDCKTEYAELNISRNDYNGLQNWIFADKEVFSVKTLQKISDNTKIENKYELNIFKVVIEMLMTKEFWIFIMFSVLMIYLSEKHRKYQVIESLFTLGVVAILFVINRALLRVYVPIYLVGILCMLYVYIKDCYKSTINKKKKLIQVLLVFIMLMPTLAYSFMAYNNVKVKEERKIQYAQEREYVHKNQDKFFVVSTMIDLMQYQPVLKISESEPFINVRDVGHWSMYNDTYYKQAELYKFKEKDRLLMNIAENDNFVYIHNTTHSMFPEIIKQYIEEHSGKKIGAEKIYEFKNTGDVVYKFFYLN